MWIVLAPSGSSPSSRAQEGSTSGSARLSRAALERLVSSLMWRATPSPARVWRVAWRTVDWIALLSGATCEPSTADAGVASWISSLAASPAKISASPAPAQGSTVSDPDCGATSPASSEKPDPDGYSSRTCSPSDVEGLIESWGTLPRSGSMRNGVITARSRSAPRTDGNGSLSSASDPKQDRPSWPTPTASDGANGAGHGETMQGGPSLRTVAAAWPTPCAAAGSTRAGDNRRTVKRGEFLGQAARTFPTPSAPSYGSSQNGINGKGGEFERPSAGTPSLETMAQRGDLPSPPHETRAPKTGAPSSGGTLTLNPRFVERLMGWPVDHTRVCKCR